MPFVPVEQTGEAQFYVQTGQGTDVVLVHGLASSLAFWYMGIMLPLRSQYRLTAYDLRGHGKSGMPPGGYTHRHMADDLYRLAGHLNLGPFHLISHSFGGLIALSFAARHPGRLRSLTLADVPIAGLQSGWPSQWPMLPQKLEKAGIHMPEDEPFPELRVLEELARLHLRGQGDRDAIGKAFAPYGFEKADKKRSKRWLKLLDETTAREDFRNREIPEEELLKIQVPTLVTYGAQSKWKASGGVLESCLPNPEVRYLEAGGHAHPWENPAEFLSLWKSFAESVESGRLFRGRERRQYERHETRTLIDLQVGGGPVYRVEAVNVSMTGILIFCPQALDIGSSVSFIPPHGENPCRHVLRGRIVRQGTQAMDKGHALGIHIPLEESNRHILAQWLHIINGETDTGAVVPAGRT